MRLAVCLAGAGLELVGGLVIVGVDDGSEEVEDRIEETHCDCACCAWVGGGERAGQGSGKSLIDVGKGVADQTCPNTLDGFGTLQWSFRPHTESKVILIAF